MDKKRQQPQPYMIVPIDAYYQPERRAHKPNPRPRKSDGAMLALLVFAGFGLPMFGLLMWLFEALK